MITSSTAIEDRWRRHKLAAIPLLVIALILSLYRNMPRSGPPVVSGALPLTQGLLARHPSTPQANELPQSDWSSWPRIELNEIVASNPFVPWELPNSAGAFAAGKATTAVKDTANASSADDNVTVSENSTKVLKEKVQAIYQDRDGTAAIVNSNIIRSGDTLDGGLEVIDVTSEGIVVKTR